MAFLNELPKIELIFAFRHFIKRVAGISSIDLYPGGLGTIVLYLRINGNI